ncbi:MAG: DUF1211 domain-containing protein [Chitinophagaceae bacterium]|nr:MAG: DUF1211 domain-containing protein [Chitinophagaceae bacterium]
MHNHRPTYRLEYFSDAVLAIAATLLATELPKPETETSLLQAIGDGKGFDTTQKFEGIGLRDMRSRAESLMGIFSLDSEVGKGSTLFVQLPYV